MYQSLLRVFILSCGISAAMANADTYPKNVPVSGECVQKHLVVGLKVEMIDDGNAVISGVTGKGAEVALIDQNDSSKGFSDIVPRQRDGSFQVTTSLTSQSGSENFTVYVLPSPTKAEVLCEFSFRSETLSADRNSTNYPLVETYNEISNLQVEIFDQTSVNTYPQFEEFHKSSETNLGGFPQYLEVTGECVQNYFVQDIKVKLVAKGKAVISGIANRGVRINVMDNNVMPMGHSGKAFRNADGSFEVETWLRSQSDLETFTLSASDAPLSSVRLCELSFYSNKGSLERELMPSQQIESDSEVILNLANKITKGATSDREKLSLIQKWMTANIKYDMAGLAQLQDGTSGWDTPSAIRTLERKTGICSEISMLSGALARAANIRNRMIVGTVKGTPHQWNEAFIDGAWFVYEAQFTIETRVDWSNYQTQSISWRL